MSDKKDDPTEIDATLLDHPGKLRLPNAHEVADAVDSVPTIEPPTKPGGSRSPGKPSRTVQPSNNPTIPLEPARPFRIGADPQHRTGPTEPDLAPPSSRHPAGGRADDEPAPPAPTIRTSRVPPASSEAPPKSAKAPPSPIVVALSIALAIAIVVIILLLRRR